MFEALIISIFIAIAAAFGVNEPNKTNKNEPNKIEYKIEYFPEYRLELRNTFEFGKWEGCQGHEFSTETTINRSLIIKEEAMTRISLSAEIIEQIKAEIYAHLKKEEGVDFGFTSTSKASAKSDCSSARKCFVNDKIRTGKITLSKNGSKINEFNFEVPSFTELKYDNV